MSTEFLGEGMRVPPLLTRIQYIALPVILPYLGTVMYWYPAGTDHHSISSHIQSHIIY